MFNPEIFNEILGKLDNINLTLQAMHSEFRDYQENIKNHWSQYNEIATERGSLSEDKKKAKAETEEKPQKVKRTRKRAVTKTKKG